ncbi:hypothetical protein B296_00006765 [Ensete ventricosum]|uniref:Uncharacterized protein n=1 Tax=Ensete ventricosum TaxID=4639 RepID=A0A426ZE78_ENSVE|nr:hypothetical protein B296_00006765 [Ensete ventricosum]
MLCQPLLTSPRRGLDDAVGNLLGVFWELVEGVGSLLGWCKGVQQKRTKTHWKIIKGSQKACRDLGRDREAHWDMLGDGRKKTIGLTIRMPEATGLAGVLLAVDPPRLTTELPIPGFYGYV